MGLESVVGNFLFRSRFSAWLWDTSTSSPFYVVRLLGATFISFVLVIRAGRLFIYTKLTRAPVLGLLFVGTLLAGLWNTLTAGSLVAVGYLLFQQFKQPTHNAGHRAGGKGFKGPLPENTLEALRDLIRRDNKQPLKDLHYVEFDVHETKDGELVILHDLGSLLGSSAEAAINKSALEELPTVDGGISRLTVQDLTLKQLQGFHIGGLKGVHVPLLADFLGCCEKEGLQRSLGVEVKSVSTDAGRTKFIELLRSYKDGYCRKLQEKCPEKQYKPFGWVAAISFPFFWASSFGEFCTPQWERWGSQFRAGGIPVRSCVLHSLDLVPPTR